MSQNHENRTDDKVIDFLDYRTRRQYTVADEVSRRDELISADGDRSYEAMKSWHRRIPVNDRKRLAENFREIIKESHLKPRNFRWETVASTPNSLRSNLSRMSNPDGALIPAMTENWIRYIDLVIDALSRRGTSVDPGLLMHQLTRGTRFHPKEQHIDNREILLLEGFETFSKMLDKKTDLLPTYRILASIAADNNLEVFKRGSDDYMLDDIFCKPEILMSDIIDDGYLRERGWSEARLSDLSHEELKEVHAIINGWDLDSDDDENNAHIRIIRDDIRELLHNTSIDTILHYKDDIMPVLWDEWDMAYLPHSLIGADVTWIIRENSNPRETFRSIATSLLDENGVIDIVGGGHNHCGQVYLMLYPDIGLKTLTPYIVTLNEEGSRSEPLRVALFNSTNDLFIPAGYTNRDELQPSKLVDLLMDVERIRNNLIASAGNLHEFPIIKDHRERIDTMEEAITKIWEDID